MKLEMQGQLRMEQRMKLAPHMIQSMEILQLPILELQERIEQELNQNPVLEVDEIPDTEQTESTEQLSDVSKEKDSAVTPGEKGVENLEGVDDFEDDFKDYIDQSDTFYTRGRSDETDGKLQALQNTAAPPQSLHEYLDEQWRMLEADEPVKKAGSSIIDYIDDRGYLAVRLEQLYNKDKSDFTHDDLKKALELVQRLEPAGIGARDLKECLLIQIAQSSKDMAFEAKLVSEYMNELLENRLPDIARKMNCSVKDINQAIERLSKFDTSPGLQIGRDWNLPVTADVIVEASEDSDGYSVRLADSSLPNLRISDYYSKMAKSKEVPENTRKFLQNNIRSAQWIMEAVEQRKNTLLRVTRAVVKFQKDFFDRGQLYLRPLPMSKVADEVGVHIATVSRAVASKYVQCYWGVLPLRKFFSGGTEDDNGTAYSWQAIRAKLQQIIDSEDKRKPLSDDQIRKKLAEAGIQNLARRTIAKYRKLMNIPAARFRKKY